jgi:integrase
MESNGKSKYTLKNYAKLLKFLSKNTNMNNPEEVKKFISKRNGSNGYKKNLCLAYNKYCQYYNIKWNIPLYIPNPKQIRIPTTENLNVLIAYAGQSLSLKLMMSKETGLRPVELMNLKVRDVDLEQKTVYPRTAKHGAPRTLKISDSLTKRFQVYIIRKDLEPNNKLFKGTAEKYGKSFRQSRNKLAKKLRNPTLRTIRLYDFRHYFASMLYKKTKDILFVKQQMGHRKIETTLVYTQLLQFEEDENYTCKVAKTIDEATQLIENGFEYVTGMDGIKLFRKRK